VHEIRSKGRRGGKGEAAKELRTEQVKKTGLAGKSKEQVRLGKASRQFVGVVSYLLGKVGLRPRYAGRKKGQEITRSD